MTRLEELTLMIQRGWGDVPQNRIPDDWRDRLGPDSTELERRAESSRRYRFRQRKGLPHLRNVEAWKARRAEYLTGKGFSPGTQFGLPFSFPEAG
jgi:hypothetical protein